MRKRTHFSQMLDIGARFFPELDEIDMLKERIIQSKNPDDDRLLAIKEDELLTNLLDICTNAEIEDAHARFQKLTERQAKSAAAPKRTRKPSSASDGTRKDPERNRRARAVAAKLDKAMLGNTANFKKLDRGDTIPVRIDHKTTLYIKPGADPEEARRKYLERNNPNRFKETIIEK